MAEPLQKDFIKSVISNGLSESMKHGVELRKLPSAIADKAMRISMFDLYGLQMLQINQLLKNLNDLDNIYFRRGTNIKDRLGYSLEPVSDKVFDLIDIIYESGISAARNNINIKTLKNGT